MFKLVLTYLDLSLFEQVHLRADLGEKHKALYMFETATTKKDRFITNYNTPPTHQYEKKEVALSLDKYMNTVYRASANKPIWTGILQRPLKACSLLAWAQDYIHVKSRSQYAE